jgi:hypothetical protein
MYAINKTEEQKKGKAIYEKEIREDLDSEFSFLCGITSRSSSIPIGKCLFSRGVGSNWAVDLRFC